MTIRATSKPVRNQHPSSLETGQRPRTALISSDDVVAARRVGAAVERAGWKVVPSTDPHTTIGVFVCVRGDLADVSAADAAAPTVVVVPDSTGSDGIRKLLAAGAEAVLLLSELELTFPAALIAVEAGLIVSPRKFRDALRHPPLTAREKQVLALVVLNFTNGEIAAKLHVTESTVKSHLSSAFSKLGVRSRSEASAIILDPKGFGIGILEISGASRLAS